MTPSKSLNRNLFASGSQSGFFTTPELTQRLNLIHHLLANSEQLLLVLAEKGLGKTTLLRQVTAAADERWKILNLSGKPDLSEDGLIAALLSDFNTRRESKPLGVLLETLRSHIASARYNGELPILVVDDAHMLPMETLKLLLQLVMTGEPQTCMRVLLFCEPQITSILAAPDFEMVRNTLIHTLDIPPFSEEQVRGYVQFRLKQAKYSNSNPFTEVALATLYQRSEGIPDKIDTYAQQVLDKHLRLNKSSRETFVTAISPSKYFIFLGLAGLAALCIALIFASGWIKETFFPPPAPAPKTVVLPELPEPSEPLFIESFEDDEAVPAPQLHPEIEAPADVTDDIAREEDTAKTPMSVPPAPAAISLPEPPPDKPAADEPSQGEDMSDLAGIKSSVWLRKQAADSYTIQVAGTYDKNAIHKFLTKHGLSGELAIFQTIHKEREWYGLVYGIYATRGEASAAIAELPASLRRATKPWPRSLANIHDKIDAARGE
ncbi:MAG: AAA family ATPase [Gammaproteobacteria bacterium]|nr:AAA family ATPase [Gammaproteobacteria bacterium]